jgi:peptide/nickel transport system permease protein
VRAAALSYVLRRAAALAATLVLAPSVAYLVMNGLRDRAPGEPSLLAGLGDWLTAAFLHLDLGLSSLPGNRTVLRVLLDGLPVDAQLVTGGLLVGLLAGSAGGIYTAVRPRSLASRGLTAASALVLSCPPYWPGLMILVLFASGTGSIAQVPFVSGLGDWAPFADDPLQWLKAMWIPVLVVAAPIAAVCQRMSAASLRETLGEDLLRTARAKGVGERAVLLRHALPLAVPAVAAITGANAITALTNVALVESAFNLPGVFREVRGMVAHPDYALIQGLVLEAAAFVGLANLLADAVQAKLDPRVGR